MKMQTGNTVVFLGAVIPEQVAWAGTDYPNLNVGDIYTLASVKQFSSFTHVTLDGVDGKFNSVHFRVV
jgi:hypothetical protein